MADLDEQLNQPSEVEKRVAELSGKVKSRSDERDAARAEAEAAATRAAEAERRAAFAESFTDIVVNNPAAKDFKDDIQAKVMAGYTPEDATYAVLGKAGKLAGPAPEAPASPAGGSASTSLPMGGTEKPVTDMTQAERRQALMDMEARGDIGVS